MSLTRPLTARERKAKPRPGLVTEASKLTLVTIDDSKHRAAQERYRRDRVAAEQRDILAKEQVRLYELGYRARKAKRAAKQNITTERLVLASWG